MITASFAVSPAALSEQPLRISMSDLVTPVDSGISMDLARRLLINIKGSTSDALYGQVLQIEMTVFSPLLKSLSVLDQRAQRLREGCRIPSRDENTRFPVLQQFGDSVDIRGDDRAAGLARLRQYQRRRIGVRRQHEDVCPQKKRKRIVLSAHECHCMGTFHGIHLGHIFRAVRTVAQDI